MLIYGIVTSLKDHDLQKHSPETLDLLATRPSLYSFKERVVRLSLTKELQEKILHQDKYLTDLDTSNHRCLYLTDKDEHELATEVLLLRHRFSELLLQNSIFRQAALTVIQNIYLFKNRRIFYSSVCSSSELDRQHALRIFSSSAQKNPLPLAKTLQHLIIARVWNRITAKAGIKEWEHPHFKQLHGVVERLNTIRNAYMILTIGLVSKLAHNINDIYKQSITYEDAIQIGTFGVARAAYRYHQSSGVRFSTYAAHWIYKEIQRQALAGRLIRISAHTVEQFARGAKTHDLKHKALFSDIIQTASPLIPETFTEAATASISEDQGVARQLENQQIRNFLIETIDRTLATKDADILKRRYGLPPYEDAAQSVIAISEIYKVTRSSVYQREQNALKTLKNHVPPELLEAS